MTTPLLQIQDLSFGYDHAQPVLSGVDLIVTAGQKLAVVGPNGGGKTTLFRLMIGALAPDHGTILIDGTPLCRSRRGLLALRQRVQLVLQDPDDQLFAASVWQDVSFGPINLGLDTDEVRSRVQGALDALTIADLADRPTHLLSFGQRKRVAIAGAVAMRPRLLILDEPTAGLDPAGVEALLGILSDLHASGTTLLLSTHDVDLAYRWATDVAVVTGGDITVAPATTALADPRLLAAARLAPAWAPVVHRLIDRDANLAGARPATPGQLAAILEKGPQQGGALP